MLGSSPRARELAFSVAGSRDSLVLTEFQLIIAGYTGRDEQSVRRHIDELAAIGVPPPESVPAFYPLDASLATQSRQVPVAGAHTSGEVEPVLVRASGRWYLTVGSDHTDRAVERVSVADSKAACPKPLSSTLVAVPESPDWDGITARCEVDGIEYQAGSLAALRAPTEVLRCYEAGHGSVEGDLVLFCGTLPLLHGEFVPGRNWNLALVLPDGTELRHGYSTVE